MKEHNYAFQNADTRPRLQSRTQNICFVISISAVIFKRIVKITSIFGSYRFLTLTHHQHSRREVMCKQEIDEINIGNARFHAQFMFDLHSFDQNIPTFENSSF